MDIETVSSNLQEIYSVIESDESDSSELIPNFSGTQVYDSTHGWGRLWTLFFYLTDDLIGFNLKNDLLHDVIVKTRVVFYEELDQIKEQAIQYQEHLKSKIAQKPIDEESFAEIKNRITNWNQLTEPFIEMIQSKRNDKLIKLFQRYVPEQIEEPFIYENEFSQLLGYQALINLEAHLMEPFPFSLFESLARGKELKKEEEQKLSQWIKYSNYYEEEMHIRTFHRGVVAFAALLTSDKKEQEGFIKSVEYELYKRELGIFKNNDLEHLAWRDGLKAGDKLYDNDKEYIIQERIQGDKDSLEDKTVYFTIQNVPERVILIGNNESRVFIREGFYEKHGWGIPMAKLDNIELSGKFAIVEKLFIPLDKHEWQTSKNELNSTDKQIIISISSSIQWMCNQGFSPLQFNSAHLMFNELGELRSTKVCMYKKLDCPMIEEFFFECSKGNLVIFKYLMKNSRLINHPYYKCYHEIMNETLKGSIQDPKGMLTKYAITNGDSIDRAKDFVEKVKIMQENCLKSIEEKYQIQRDTKVIALVNHLIVKIYQSHYSGITIWPILQEKVCDYYLYRSNLKI